MNYLQFKAKWLGKRVDIDGVYGYQCVDLAKQYMLECYGVPNGAYGNAVDYWHHTHPNILAKFDKLSTKDCRQGDIIVLQGVNGNPYGHIGVADGAKGLLYVPMLEQNGSTGNGSGVGADAIRVSNKLAWRILGVLRQKTAQPTPGKMPGIGARVQFTIPRTAFKSGTGTVAGTLPPDTRTVRGYDPVFPNRILVNSASIGNGVAVALYYAATGAKIEGWVVI